MAVVTYTDEAHWREFAFAFTKAARRRAAGARTFVLKLPLLHAPTFGAEKPLRKTHIRQSVQQLADIGGPVIAGLLSGLVQLSNHYPGGPQVGDQSLSFYGPASAFVFLPGPVGRIA
jgi:hypothetical protein